MITDKLLAKLCEAEYNNELPNPFKGLGVTSFHRLQGDNAECSVIHLGGETVVVFRGTEKDGKDILTDLKGWPSKTPLGRIHKGFYSYFMKLWPLLQAYLSRSIEENRPIYLTGHSLGGAAAAVCARQFIKDGIAYKKLVTFGQPRTGFGTTLKPLYNYTRYVYGDDAVARVPSWIWGYKHYGALHKLGRPHVGLVGDFIDHKIRNYSLSL